MSGVGPVHGPLPPAPTCQDWSLGTCPFPFLPRLVPRIPGPPFSNPSMLGLGPKGLAPPFPAPPHWVWSLWSGPVHWDQVPNLVCWGHWQDLACRSGVEHPWFKAASLLLHTIAGWSVSHAGQRLSLSYSQARSKMEQHSLFGKWFWF